MRGRGECKGVRVEPVFRVASEGRTVEGKKARVGTCTDSHVPTAPLRKCVLSSPSFLFLFLLWRSYKNVRVHEPFQLQGGHLMSLFVLKAASSCLRYLMAVQNHLLSNTVLIKPDENDDSDSSLQGETLKVQVNTSSLSTALPPQLLDFCVYDVRVDGGVHSLCSEGRGHSHHRSLSLPVLTPCW